MENEGDSGATTAVDLGVNVGSTGRHFGHSEDQSVSMEANAQKSPQSTQQNQLNARLNEENEQDQEFPQSVQQNQQIPFQNQQNMLQNLQMQQLQQNAQPSFQQNQLSYDQNSQIQRNVVQNPQNMEAHVRVQHYPHSLQQIHHTAQHGLQNSHHNAQILHLQQNQHGAMRSAHVLQGSSSPQLLAKPALSASQQRMNSVASSHESGGENMEASQELRDGYNRDMRELEDLLSKLNPMAKEFIPPSLASHASAISLANAIMHNNINFNINGSNDDNDINNNNRRRKNNYQGKRRVNSRTSIAQREDSIRRTVYVSDIDQQVTEEQLAALFINCGQVVDCRVCGDPNSVLRFAFVEFTHEEEARRALSLAGTMLGYYPVRVLPSKTAIAPVNPTFLPRSEDEREMCARTIYCTNIDKKVSQADVKLFFESLCGEVSRLRLLGDYHHSTRIAFVEFVMAESAIAALNCSGAILGSLPIRVSPSKTPVRPRTSRSPMH